MMDGITVLNQTSIYETPWYTYLIGAMLFIGFIIFLIMATENKKALATAIFATLGCLCLVGALLSFGGVLIQEFKYEQYDVTIGEDVNFVEFNQRYEVITQKGLIYTIKERESNDVTE